MGQTITERNYMRVSFSGSSFQDLLRQMIEYQNDYEINWEEINIYQNNPYYVAHCYLEMVPQKADES